MEITVEFTYHSMTTILTDSEWTSRISSTSARVRVSSADHVLGDWMMIILAHGVAYDRDICLLKGVGHTTPISFAPTSGSGTDTIVRLFPVVREACGAHAVGERDRLRQTKDGIVIVQCGCIVVVVHDDLSNVTPPCCVYVVLSKVYLDLRWVKVDPRFFIFFNTVCCGEDMGGGDEGPSAQFVLSCVKLHTQSHLSKDIVTDFYWNFLAAFTSYTFSQMALI